MPEPDDSSAQPGSMTVRPASVADVPALAGVLARAFVRDPMVAWPMVTKQDLVTRIRAVFELVDTGFAAEAWMYQVSDGLGVMALLPPDSEARQVQLEAAASAAVNALMPDGGERYERMWAWIAATLPTERHWLLDQLAVEPAAQGRGIGAAMVRFSIGCARADGVPLFLETATASNVALYERFGFHVMLEGDVPGGGPHIWFMRWDPSARPGSPEIARTASG